MPFSLRLDPETEALIRRLSADTGRSRASVVREAVAHYSAASAATRRAPESAFDRLNGYGTVDTGGKNYSMDTHRKYRESLLQKHRAKRSR